MKLIVRNKIPQLIKDRDMTQKQFAEKAGLTEATVSRLKRQDRFDIATLFLASRALDVSIEDMFEVEEEKRPDSAD